MCNNVISSFAIDADEMTNNVAYADDHFERITVREQCFVDSFEHSEE